jgi:hypothetical protein
VGHLPKVLSLPLEKQDFGTPCWQFCDEATPLPEQTEAPCAAALRSFPRLVEIFQIGRLLVLARGHELTPGAQVIKLAADLDVCRDLCTSEEPACSL